MIPESHSFSISQGANFGPELLPRLEDASGNAINIAGATVYANAQAGGLMINLAPYVSNGANGEVSLGNKTATETRAIVCGVYDWDAMLVYANGQIIGPTHMGRVKVLSPITQTI